MVVCKYFFYFVIFSVCGWIYESLYVSIRTGKWDNRGFLYGPVVPIYGVGAGLLMILQDVLNYHNVSYTWWQVFLVGCIGSFILEYTTHYTLEKLFHAVWWDYTRMPFNINGRVCLPYTLAFGVAALLCIYGIIPFFVNITGWINPYLFELFALISMALLAADIALTVTALADFNKKVIAVEESFNGRMESVMKNVQDGIESGKNAVTGVRTAMDERKLQKALAEMEEASLDSDDKEKKLRLPEVKLPSVDDIRRTFTREQLENYMNDVSALRKSALKRVQGYRGTKKSEKKFHDEVVSFMREKFSKKK